MSRKLTPFTILLGAVALIVACGESRPSGSDASAVVFDNGSTPSDAAVATMPPAPPLTGAERPAPPVKNTGDALERVAVATTESKVAAAPARPSVATPPLPSADLYNRARASAGESDGSGGLARESRPGGLRGLLGIGSVAESAAEAPSVSAPMAAAPPPPSAAPRPAPAPRSAARSAVARSSGSTSGLGGGGASPTKRARRARAPSAPGVLGPHTVRSDEAAAPTDIPMIPAAGRQMVPQRQVLTAGAVSDVDHRDSYISYLARHGNEAQRLRLEMSRRVRFLIIDAQRRPVHDAFVTLIGSDDRPFTGRTHADGIWDFFPGVSAPQMSGQVTVQVQRGQSMANALVEIPSHGDGQSYMIQLPNVSATLPRRLELAFVIDVTGSMGDELRYVNEEVTGIVERVRAAVPQIDVRVAATFYRDRGDSVPIEQIPFSSDLTVFTNRMRHVRATGGGDYPEDLDSGLAAAMHTLQWTQDGAARVMVVIADAPPQRYGDQQYDFHHAMEDAARRGIRLLPVAASGSNREVEFLFRAMGIFTSNPYLYLTDDSGVGGSHMEADSEHVSREMFSDMLTRLLIADLQGEGMH